MLRKNRGDAALFILFAVFTVSMIITLATLFTELPQEGEGQVIHPEEGVECIVYGTEMSCNWEDK